MMSLSTKLLTIKKIYLKKYDMDEEEFKKLFLLGSFIGICIIAFIFLMIISSCSYLNQRIGLKDDNAAEEIIEQVFYSETGVDLDFTPSTPEKK